ncbi:hypothetical protein JXA84_04665 [candidate division WOR-3 bacterium]|nr:hypothetical protein [candidate division WOR-3 bacterium]
MKKCFYSILFGLFIPSLILPVFEDVETSPRAEGMAEAVTACPADPLEAVYNPAGIAFFRATQMKVFYKKPFGLINSAGASIVFENPLGATALNARWLSLKGEFRNADSFLVSSDAQLHRELYLSLTHAVIMNEYLYAGASVNAYSLKQERFGSAYALGLDAGLIGTLYGIWNIGFSVRNLNSPTLGKESLEYLPRVVRAGVAFHPAENINTTLDFRQEMGYPLRVSFGQEYGVSEYLLLRAGIQTEPVRFSAGLTVKYAHFEVDYSIVQHSILPFTHIMSMGYTL